MSALLTPDEYVTLLQQRADEWEAERPRIPGFPPLLEWFIRDDDHTLVDMGALDAQLSRWEKQPKRQPKPRTYKPASHWREQIRRIDNRLAALNGVKRHDTTDRAAYGGIGIRQTVRQRAKYAARIDRTASEVVRLTERRANLEAKLIRAEAREARHG